MHDTATAFDTHDHAGCAADAMTIADAKAKRLGLRLTPVRRRALEVLLEEHRALGAYDVLERLSADGFGAQPPVAYRALEFLVEHGFAHRIERLNAFAACMHSGESHEPVFFICESCKRVAEAPQDTMQAAIGSVAERIGFLPKAAQVEVFGQCSTCTELG